MFVFVGRTLRLQSLQCEELFALLSFLESQNRNLSARRYRGWCTNAKTDICEFHVLAWFYKGFSYAPPRSADCSFSKGFPCFPNVDLDTFETDRLFAFHLALSGGAAQIIVLPTVFYDFRKIYLASGASKRHVSESHLICIMISIFWYKGPSAIH